MNDLERTLRELLETKAKEATVDQHIPDAVRTRGRRRQVGVVLASALTAAALISASVVGINALRGGHHPVPAVSPVTVEPSATTRTITLQGFTFTSPSNWVVVDLWPEVCSMVTTGTCQTPSGVFGNGALTARPQGAPVFTVANYDVGLPTSGATPVANTCPPAPPATGAALYVALDTGAAFGKGPGLPATVYFSDTPSNGPCGLGHYAVPALPIDGHRYFAFATAGAGASATTLAQIEAAWNHHIAAAVRPPPPRWTNPSPPFYAPAGNAGPGYVLATGTIAGIPWLLEQNSPSLAEEASSLQTTSDVLSLHTSGQRASGLRSSQIASTNLRPSGAFQTAAAAGPWPLQVLFGEIDPSVRSVSYLGPDGGRLLTVPLVTPSPLVHAAVNVFAVTVPAGGQMFWRSPPGDAGNTIPTIIMSDHRGTVGYDLRAYQEDGVVCIRLDLTGQVPGSSYSNQCQTHVASPNVTWVPASGRYRGATSSGDYYVLGFVPAGVAAVRATWTKGPAGPGTATDSSLTALPPGLPAGGAHVCLLRVVAGGHLLLEFLAADGSVVTHSVGGLPRTGAGRSPSP